MDDFAARYLLALSSLSARLPSLPARLSLESLCLDAFFSHMFYLFVFTRHAFVILLLKAERRHLCHILCASNQVIDSRMLNIQRSFG